MQDATLYINQRADVRGQINQPLTSKGEPRECTGVIVYDKSTKTVGSGRTGLAEQLAHGNGSEVSGWEGGHDDIPSRLCVADATLFVDRSNQLVCDVDTNEALLNSC